MQLINTKYEYNYPNITCHTQLTTNKYFDFKIKKSIWMWIQGSDLKGRLLFQNKDNNL